MHVVYSRVSEDEAVEQLRPLVDRESMAARATLSYVAEVRAASPEYITDRAYRIITAAIENRSPAPVRPEDAEIFERQRGLGWQPLEDAFEQLAISVPELREIARDASRRVGKDKGKEQRGNIADLQRRVRRLVGPRSGHSDPLVRSDLARSIAIRYVNAVAGGPHAADPQRPLWELDAGQGDESGGADALP